MHSMSIANFELKVNNENEFSARIGFGTLEIENKPCAVKFILNSKLFIISQTEGNSDPNTIFDINSIDELANI